MLAFIDAENPKPEDQFPVGRRRFFTLIIMAVSRWPTYRKSRSRMCDPVFELWKSSTRTGYALRIRGQSYRPPVFDADRTYHPRVVIGSDLWKTLKAQKPVVEGKSSPLNLNF